MIYTQEFRDRFWSRVKVTHDCWGWTQVAELEDPKDRKTNPESTATPDGLQQIILDVAHLDFGPHLPNVPLSDLCWHIPTCEGYEPTA